MIIMIINMMILFFFYYFFMRYMMITIIVTANSYAQGIAVESDKGLKLTLLGLFVSGKANIACFDPVWLNIWDN